MTKLTNTDYRKIINYYNIDTTNKTNKEINNIATKLLAEKLCRCIKKVNKPSNNEARAIAICKTNVLHKKGVNTAKFYCRNKTRFGKNGLRKLRKNNTTKKIINYNRKKNNTHKLRHKTKKTRKTIR
jgi:hypothetical protein